jgi:Xaa-Pro aminopeptidase
MKAKINSRITRLRRSLAARGLDAALVTGPENRFYLSGFLAEDLCLTESAGALVITRDRRILLTDGRYEIQAEKQAPGFDIIIYRQGLAHELKALFRRVGVQKCAFEPAFISCSRLEILKKSTPRIFWQNLGDICQMMRARKDRKECARLKSAQRAAESVFEQVLPEIRPGRTEKEIAFMILKGLCVQADGPSFPPIVASGPNSALPHALPGNRKIRRDEPVIIDMGARLDGYCSDMTRTVFCGEPSQRLKTIYTTVKRAQQAAQLAIRPGMTGREADHLARKVIAEAGFGSCFIHSLGHGVGIAIHEAPTLSPRCRKKLKAGMVFTVEPGIYVAGEGGVRLENMGLLKEDGLEVMTSDRWFNDF